VRVFNPHSPSSRTITPSSMYQKHEKAKRRAYDQRFTQNRTWLFLTFDLFHHWRNGWSSSESVQEIGWLMAEKKGQDYSKMLKWLRCRLNFALLRYSIMCLRGTRSKNPPSTHDDASPDVLLQECRISSESFTCIPYVQAVLIHALYYHTHLI